MYEVWKWANLTVAFVVELAAFAAFALWGWQAADSTPVKLVAAVGAPVLAIAAWGLFAAPNSVFDRPLLTLVTEILVFGGAAIALWAASYRTAAVVFVAVLVANLLAIRLGHLRP
ncbi:MAG: YrdB family protein [Nocardia sp.]|nr:YrdB family protein [Nocardia sp.]NUS94439.1 YrdB family protein [Nocardia sp.]